MDYSFKITTGGRELLAALLATGKELEITRVAVGSGKVAESVNLADMTDLIQYVAEGKITQRRHQDNVLYLTVQYSSNSTPGLGAFYLAEFIVVAKHPISGENVTLLYATLGDYIQPVNAYSETRPPDIRNYPLVIAISDEIEVSVTAPAGLVTYDDLKQEMEEAREELEAAMEDLSANVGSVIIKDITIPADAWVETAEAGKYKFVADAADMDALDEHYPSLALDIASLDIASAAGMCPTIETLDGRIRFWVKEKPAADLVGTLKLESQSAAAVGSSGGVASDKEASDAAEEVFGAGGTVVPNQAVIAADSEVASEVSGIFGV